MSADETPLIRRSKRQEGRRIAKAKEDGRCKLCDLDNTQEMVQCDECLQWYHFNCVNVTAAIEEEDWSCAQCLNQKKADAESVRSKKTSSTNRRQIELQILEESRELEKKRDEDYLRKKLDLLVNGSQKSACSESYKDPKDVENWIRNQNDVQHQALAVNTMKSAQITTQINQHLGIHIPATTMPHNPGPSTSLHHANPRNLQQESAQPDNVQLANRHSMSRDLPNFYGSPEEWPLFISTYDRSTRLCGFSNEENLLRLQKCLKGQVLETMRGRLMLPSNVPNIIQTMRIMYGRPKVIIKSLLQKIQTQPRIQIEKVETIISYSLAVQNLISTIEACDLQEYLHNAELLDDLVSKLPTQLMLDWAKAIEGMTSYNLLDFDEWLFRLIDNICKVSPAISFNQDSRTPMRKKEKAHINTHSEEDVKTPMSDKRRCKICSQDCCGVHLCKRFKNMSLNDKWNAIKQNRLCRTCLKSHPQSRCRLNTLCGVKGCIYRHHPLLHKNTSDTVVTGTSTIEVQTTETSQATSTDDANFNCNTHRSTHNIKYRVVPVVLHAEQKHIATFAFLDDGSSLTMMEDSLAKELDLKGINQPLFLKWTGNTHRNENESRIVSVEVSGREHTDKRFKIPIIRTVKSLNLPQQSLDVEELRAKYPYLRGYPIQSYEKAVPRLLIGLDNLKLAIPLKVVEGGEGDPVATKTRLGWVAYGPSSVTDNNTGESFHSYYHECECATAKLSDADYTLHNMMKDYFSLDSLGVGEPKGLLRSQDDERACKMLESLTIRIGCRFTTGLLWKYENIKLPESFQMALKRHHCFAQKLKRNPDLGNKIKNQIKEYENKRYIRKLSKNELEHQFPRTWYLPIFVVTNQNKPGKTRIVWDAAAEVNGVSLNSVLLKGPDQLVCLLSVLYRFRERRVAICADIREMFHQIEMRADDQHAQRFLWSNDLHATPDVYVMQVLTFGASCSPSCAQFVKNKNALEFAEQYPRAVDSILHSHYVDDLLDSVDSEEEAIKLGKEVKYIHQNGGFEIRNWISNSPKVMEALGEQPPASRRSLDINPESTSEKVLGMWWCIQTDTFTFSVSKKASMIELLSEDFEPTKRQILRVLMSIFDPLGLIGNSLIYIKILMQEIWRSKLSWDEKIEGKLCEKWRVWVNHLKNIDRIHIPRCYLKQIMYGEHDTCQLHIFVDASINAFAAVAFIRVTKGNLIECRIISSKTRVAPLRLTSIPRLELDAARLGVRLANSIKQYHAIKFSEEFYWSDSKTVLSWIQSDHRNYKQYVGFRVSEILETTETHLWRYIPSKDNVADDATKWEKIPDFDMNSRWFVGPPFLMQDENKWPLNLSNLQETAEELKASILFHHTVHNQALIDSKRFSNWQKLVRTQAYISRFIYNTRAIKKKVPKRDQKYITHGEYVESERSLYLQAQLDSFRDEISILKNNLDLPLAQHKSLDKSSFIRKMSPFIDQDGLLRLRGRIDAVSGVSYDAKNPIILPKDSYITFLIIKSFHETYHHHNNETVVNEIRQKFSIANIRTAVKQVRKKCQLCKNLSASPKPPEMGVLPEARLAPFTRPFTFIGIDYFGPMYTTVGRHTEKRWGVLITCMTTRAVHLEIAHSLTSDSCILAIKRFIARRGVPKEIRCDNGTNFHGAEKELKETYNELQSDMAKKFSTSQTQWIYNPPASPHMGGSWERLVRSIKKTLYQIMPSRNPTDELLHSMLLEVERVVNSRPLTYIALEDANDEVLTPNHFLLGSSNGEKTDSIPTNDNTLLRRNWMKAQQYANLFWRKWLHEYLPTLTRRSKWFTPTKPIAVGDIVIVTDESNPRNLWPKGRVIDVKPGKDGQVRRATVQTVSGIYERPAVKLAVLDVFRDIPT
ncbi:uncharacterized protein LOC129950632 [Eupeodes corollae]|uniref:uncharacterized protein LOC129950632 n=1 Tax=Eupeodes corollae TaxID=290404 RepID=UPI0024937638|nr:uncharacterized protein LOC129950632 [Eupeodes corollae]